MLAVFRSGGWGHGWARWDESESSGTVCCHFGADGPSSGASRTPRHHRDCGCSLEPRQPGVQNLIFGLHQLPAVVSFVPEADIEADGGPTCPQPNSIHDR